MVKAAVFAFVAFILSGCATSGVTGISPAHQAEVRAGPPVQEPPSIRMSVLPGWRQFERAELGSASTGFRNDAARAVISAKVIPAGDETLGPLIRGVVGDIASNGAACGTPAVTEESYATVRCESRGEDPPTRSIIAVRRPGGRHDLLLIMTGVWPASLPQTFDEEVDLMFLMASAE